VTFVFASSVLAAPSVKGQGKGPKKNTTAKPCDSFAGVATTYGKNYFTGTFGVDDYWLRSTKLDAQRVLVYAQDLSGSFLTAINAATGLPDQTFGQRGRANGPRLFQGAPLVGSDAIYIVGTTAGASYGDISIQRFSRAGIPDTAFGEGSVRTTVVKATVYDALLTADEKILIGGMTPYPYNAFLARFQPNGDLDTTFGNSGILIIEQSQGREIVQAMTVLPDGKFLTAGFGGSGTYGEALQVRKYLSNGSADTSFGTNGIAQADPGRLNYFTSLLVNPANGAITVGLNINTHGNAAFVIAQFTQSGQLDSRFGTNGLVISPMTSGIYSTEALVRSPSTGSLTFTGIFNDWDNEMTNGVIDMHVTRLTSAGVLDASFQSGGLLFGGGTWGNIWPGGRSYALESVGTQEALFVAGVTEQGQLAFACINP
jgi:uncharacterized delta-60 repeat protein